MTTQNYDIWIDRGADFFLSLLCRDDSGNLIDLTGAEITAQLREYPESLDYKQFTTEHNGEGGQILLTMAHEDTADIGYTSGVYDVFVELSGGSMQKYITGDVTISPSVTRPVYGQIAYLLEFASEADFPPVGQTRRVYFSQATTKMYRWNGTAYVGYTDYYTKAEITTLLSGKSDVGHDHDARYYTETEMDTALSAKEDIANLKALAYKDKADFYDDIANLPSGYPPSPHNHDDRYYTEMEVDTALSGKSDVGHTHDYDDLTNKPTLGSMAEKNSVDYDTDIENLPTLGALAAKSTVDWDTDIDDIPTAFPPESHNHDDRYYTETESDALLDEKLDAHSTTETGAVVSFTAENTSAIKGLSVCIEPVQDLHGYANPWPAGGGKNILPNITKGTYTSNGITVVVGDNNLITVSGTKDTNSAVTIEMGYDVSGQDNVYGYYIHLRNVENNSIRFYFGTASSIYSALNSADKIQQVNQTMTFESCAMYFGTGISSGTEISMTLQPSVEPTNDTTDWTPYSNICPITGHTEANVYLEDEYDADADPTVTVDLDGTRYGGTLNVLTGVLTVTDGYIASYNGETLSSTWISDRDVYVEGNNPTTGAEVVYKLATPFTVQLTANQVSALIGENNIWADTGDTTVTHLQVTGDLAYQDTVDYETQVTNKPDFASMISGVETSMVATKNYTQGSLVSVGDNLYRATSAIANGSAIVVGTNVVATTVEEVIAPKYGVCDSAADAVAKTVTIPNFILTTGSTVFVKFTNAQSASNPTLNVSGSGDYPIYKYGTTAVGTTSATTGWQAGSALALTFDGTGWIQHLWQNTQYTIYGAYCTTSASTAGKSASCTYFALRECWFELTMRYANTKKGALTLNVASTGALPIYINGSASSSSNYTLPAGMYIVYTDGTKYYFRTDGKIEGLCEEAPKDGHAYVRKDGAWVDITTL